jgi:hypothetical protein
MNAKEAKNLTLINSYYEIETIENLIIKACHKGESKTKVDIGYMTDEAKNYLRVNDYLVSKVITSGKEYYEVSWE